MMTKLLWIPIGFAALLLLVVGCICNGICTFFAYGDDWCDRGEQALLDFMRQFD